MCSKYCIQTLTLQYRHGAEYEALLDGLRMAVSMGIQRLEVRGDSNLAISQINGDFYAKDPKMAAYRNAVLKMSARFEGLEFHHVARESIQAADVLARIGAKRDPSHLTSFWKGFLSHPWCGKGRAATPVRIQTQPQILNTPISSGVSHRNNTVGPSHYGRHCPMDQTLLGLP